MTKKHRLIFLIFPVVLFAIGIFLVLRSTFRGVEVYPLMTGFVLIFIGLFAFVLILGQILLQRTKRN